jgi:hypothetical protein
VITNTMSCLLQVSANIVSFRRTASCRRNLGLAETTTTRSLVPRDDTGAVQLQASPRKDPRVFSHSQSMGLSRQKPMYTRVKTGRENPPDRKPLQAHSRDPHTYRIPPGELPGGVGCKRAGVWRAWRAVR